MERYRYRISFQAAEGISFFAYYNAANEIHAINRLLADVAQNGCPPFWPEFKTVEKIERVEREN